MTLYTPVVANDVWSVAFPFASNVTVPSVVVAYEKITCPVGMPPPDWVTFAKNVTLSPVPAVVLEEVRVVVVGNCKGTVVSGTFTTAVAGNCSESMTVNVTTAVRATAGSYWSTFPSTIVRPRLAGGVEVTDHL